MGARFSEDHPALVYPQNLTALGAHCQRTPGLDVTLNRRVTQSRHRRAIGEFVAQELDDVELMVSFEGHARMIRPTASRDKGA